MHDTLHNHDHSHTHDADKGVQNSMILKYMLDHNIQHVEDAKEFAEKLNKVGDEEAAQLLMDAVTHYVAGNEQMELALKKLNDKEK